MRREELLEAITSLPVWDTHTHLRGTALAARSFWDIGHYFWFLEELLAAGYPAGYRELPEHEREVAFVRAYHATRNTTMHWVVERILGDLYGLQLGDAASVLAAGEAVRDAAGRADWAGQVCRRGAIRRIVVNEAADAPFDGLPATSCYVPRVEGHVRDWLTRLAGAPDATSATAIGGAVGGEIEATLAAHRGAGCGGVMTSLEAFGPPDRLRRLGVPGDGPQTGPGDDPASQAVFVLRTLCRAAEAHGLFVQLLSGIEPVRGGRRAPVNDPGRLLSLYPLFRDYACTFELLLGSSADNLDAAIAARLFPNVCLGGMWWYNFRASTYRASMQYRLEGLPASRSVLIASDARCIEWGYGKVVLVKRLLAEFLHAQIEGGWLGREDALWVAREWLHDAAARYDGHPAGTRALP